MRWGKQSGKVARSGIWVYPYKEASGGIDLPNTNHYHTYLY